ncbi:hypothetical protein VB713_13980 [Anabaena cylindrica UHCC 0172]|uniref:hypothetical protein n=1 Tax=Anabaena cylindrica TaxID=1165 RepID=UPI002B1FBD85|nr:hypothetical protein [Anabaena cylindrica]MEA5552053.1 hypothetical protein [Anabaena cylindrica UHCC 0172]
MPSIRIWTPESDYDRDAVCCIARKIAQYYDCDLTIDYATKSAFSEVARKPGGLKKAVDIYLKRDDLVIFLIDSDGIQSQAQRRKENNSLLNQIQQVVQASEGKAKLILMVQEFEAWLLVDCLGICCYFTEKPENRYNQDWINFSRRKQLGKTNLIAESESGGRGAKEYLEQFSREILIKKNPNLKNKLNNLKNMQYEEKQSPKVADYIEIDDQSIRRNDSLEEFAKCLKDLGLRNQL